MVSNHTAAVEVESLSFGVLQWQLSVLATEKETPILAPLLSSTQYRC